MAESSLTDCQFRSLRSEDEGLVLEDGDREAAAAAARRLRKITPPPWSKISFTSTSESDVEGTEFTELVTSIPGSANPFKRKLFRSLVGNEARNLLSDVPDPTNAVKNLFNFISNFENFEQHKILVPAIHLELERHFRRKSENGSRCFEEENNSPSLGSLRIADVLRELKGFSPERRRASGASKVISGKIKSSQSAGCSKTSHSSLRKSKFRRNSSFNKLFKSNSRKNLKALGPAGIQCSELESAPSLDQEVQSTSKIDHDPEFASKLGQRAWNIIKPIFQSSSGGGNDGISNFLRHKEQSNAPFDTIPKTDLLVDTYRTLNSGSLVPNAIPNEVLNTAVSGASEEKAKESPVYFHLGSPTEDGWIFDKGPYRNASFSPSRIANSQHPNSDEFLDLGHYGAREHASADEWEDAFISGCDSGLGMESEGYEDSNPDLLLEEGQDTEPVYQGGIKDDDILSEEVLCGNRVSQMTRTYHDIEAVTRLLQEKEKDLELAARIGQQLLARNKGLQEKNSSLEAELCSSSERITQLKHDLLMKTDLLQIYTNDFDDSSAENTPTSLRHINVDLLQRRVKTLENENVYLREEASQLADDTDYCEEKEKELVNDVIKQLNEANLQVNQLSDELSRKIEDNLRQQEELTQLLAQVVDLQATNKRRTRENEELGSLIGVARECQQELSTELAELKEKYAEVLDLLHDTQEQLRRVQKKSFPGSRVSHLGGGGMFSSLHFGSDSIASELHSLSSAEDQTEKTDGAKCLSRVFDTVRLSSKLGNSLPPAGYTGSPVYSTPTKQASQVASHFSTPLHMTGSYSSYFGSGVSIGGSSGLHSLDSGAESDGSFPTDSEDNYPASRPGVPGWPGTPDLDSCLRRLGPQDRNSLSYLPYGCRTPDSIMSTGSAKSGMSSYSSQNWKLPQKLQIVKPIEGSLTLHHWSRLATPHLGGLLEDKEGIAVKGATNSGLNLELYSMSDLEEEEEEEENEENKCFPGKQFMSTSGVFTYTNSTVLHPDDVTNLTSSLRQTQMSALPSAPVYDSLPSTPSHSASSQPPSRRGSTATFSTSIGIAKHLRERGFTDEPQSSALPLTATPANSPEGTRAGTPEPYTYKLPCFEDLTRHFHAGASFIRRHFYGDITPSNASSPGEGPKVNLVERIHALGVERLVGSTEFTQSVGGVVMTRPQPVSPLLHLSNLIRSNAKNTSGVTTTGDSSSSTQGSIMSTPRITSPGERRPQIPTGAPMGIPGHPGAGHLDSRLTQLKPGQRLDLGTVGSVGSRPRPAALGSVPLGRKDEKMGTIGWTSLGRKGGLS